MIKEKRPLRLLVIAPYCIDPADTGGKIRVWELVRGLSSEMISVTVMMPMTPASLSGKAINPHLALKTVPYPFILPFLFTDKPFSYNVLISLHSGYRLLLKKMMDLSDIIQFEGVSFGDLADHVPPGTKVIYDAHNVEADYVYSEHPEGWIGRIATGKIRRLEEKLARRADRILTCSQADAERIAYLYHVSQAKCSVIPNGMHWPVKKQPPMDEIAKEISYKCRPFHHRVIFSGSDAAHNREAVGFLIRTVAPRFRRRCALIIQGPCGRKFKGIGADNVFFDPRPGHVGLYADICTAAVNPVIQGSGTSLKVLDYLVHGLPLISTPFGMRGYEDLHEYIHLTERDLFSEAITRDPSFHPGTGRALEKYAWSSITRQLADVCHAVMEIPNDS